MPALTVGNKSSIRRKERKKKSPYFSSLPSWKGLAAWLSLVTFIFLCQLHEESRFFVLSFSLALSCFPFVIFSLVRIRLLLKNSWECFFSFNESCLWCDGFLLKHTAFSSSLLFLLLLLFFAEGPDFMFTVCETGAPVWWPLRPTQGPVEKIQMLQVLSFFISFAYNR